MVRRFRPLLASALLLGCLAAPAGSRADVRFQNCTPAPGGGITCDTRPEGNTLLNDEAARFGLFNDASPGWDEFNPYQGVDQMLGGNQS
ncbi:hypothetical protein [Cyanobium sp. ATX 6F1]|uniref:hypothetical protein n=1 Tax=unclassified Cyanobium TaxID=2627006 RepID=UPI0020CBEFC2|nr:hypothetical protein [Cyanobium sp. ATX 6F1]